MTGIKFFSIIYIVNGNERWYILKIFLKKILIFALVLMISVASFSSCSGDRVNDILGIDSTDYEAEEIIGDAKTDVDVLSTVTSIISALTVNSNILPEFENSSDIASVSSDTVLNYMLTTSYSRYNSDKKLLDEAEKEYPNMNITAAIGIEALEDEMYKLFGYNGAIRHANTERFSYLSKIKAYTPAANAEAQEATLDIISLDETENTYRMTFYSVLDGTPSVQYFALFIKRENDSCYIKTLRKAADEKVNVPIIDSVS